MTQGRFLAVLFAIIVAIPRASFCQGVELLPSEIREVQTTKGVISCGLYGGNWLPGAVAKDGKTFTAFAWQIKKLKKTLSNTTDEVKKAKLSKKITTLSRKKKVGVPACKESEDSPPPGSTPGPTPTSTPRPRCYDENRNTSCFGIPDGVQGNEGRGESLFEGICSGCHMETERRNRSYSDLQNAFNTVLEMKPFTADFTSQDIADLVAYLNRYNPNQ